MTDMYMGEDEVGNLLADGIGTRYLSVTISSLLEAIMSGTSVYVTGYIFLKKLENDGSKLNFQDLIKLRRKGRLALGKTVIEEIPKELVTKCSEEMWTFIKNLFNQKSLTNPKNHHNNKQELKGRHEAPGFILFFYLAKAT